MRNFDYQTPTRLIFGKGVVEKKLKSVMAQFGKRVLITYGGGSIKRSGLYDQVLQILQDKPMIVKIKVSYQACDDTMCLPPVEHIIEYDLADAK